MCRSTAGNTAAQAPDPTQDPEEGFVGCRPCPCDLIDFESGVRNNCTTHNHVLRITGTPHVDDSGPQTCCGGAVCLAYSTVGEQIIESGACDAGHTPLLLRPPLPLIGRTSLAFSKASWPLGDENAMGQRSPRPFGLHNT